MRPPVWTGPARFCPAETFLKIPFRFFAHKFLKIPAQEVFSEKGSFALPREFLPFLPAAPCFPFFFLGRKFLLDQGVFPWFSFFFQKRKLLPAGGQAREFLPAKGTSSWEGSCFLFCLEVPAQEVSPVAGSFSRSFLKVPAQGAVP